MPKFTFICEDDPMPFSESIVTKRTVEFDAVHINDVVSEFELFLRGAGFNPHGTLDFIPEDEYWGAVQDTNIDFEHSDSYFDTERNK
jgi:hypothetical protein